MRSPTPSLPNREGVILLIFLLLSACVSNKSILKEVFLLKSAIIRLDSVYRSTQINLYQYEKNRIDSTRYDRMPDDELLQRAKSAIKNNRR